MAFHSPRFHPAGNLAGLSLCAGVGGLELGIQIAEPNYRTVCFVEREAGAAATLVARMDDQALDQAPIWSDLRTFDGRQWRGKVHLLTAGYPCQPFSAAGLRRGSKDPRHLWPDVARVAKEAEVEWIFCENVEGHLNLGLPEVIRDLQDMGYEAKAGLFSAAEVGATHLRRRIFILAHADSYRRRKPDGPGVQPEGDAVSYCDRPDRQSSFTCDGDAIVGPDGDLGQVAGRPYDGPEELPLFAPAPFELEAWDAILGRRMDLQPQLFGLGDGLAHRLERSHAGGNGVVPLEAAYAWRTLKAAFNLD